MKTSRILELAGLPNHQAKLLEVVERSVLSVMGKQPTYFDDIFNCVGKELTSLNGSPTRVGKSFSCMDNKLTSLEGSPKHIEKDFICTFNNLTSLQHIYKHIKYIGGFADFSHNNINANVLGLLMIDGLTSVILDNKKVAIIINRYLKDSKKAQDRDVIACQDELEEFDFEMYAKL